MLMQVDIEYQFIFKKGIQRLKNNESSNSMYIFEIPSRTR